MPSNPEVPSDENAKSIRKKHRMAVVASWVAGFALAGVYYAAKNIPAAGWRTNDVTTSETPEYPDLVSRLYDASLENTTVLTAAAASRLPNWKVIRTDTTLHRVECEVKMPLGLFTDDVTVQVEPWGTNAVASRVKIRSHSRVGRGDLGFNARHIRELQTAMDDKLPLFNP